MTPESSITRTMSGSYELHLKGRFSHPHWVAFLFSGLAEAQVSVISGRASQSGIQEWDARINLDFRRCTLAPGTFDYVALAQRKPAAMDMSVPRLTSYEIMRRRDQELEVRLEGPDQIGFLGRFLGRMALLMLFPSDIEINTVAGVIRDRVVFRGVGGAVPTPEAQQSLDTLLRGMVVKS
jgi:hypothetical protein